MHCFVLHAFFSIPRAYNLMMLNFNTCFKIKLEVCNTESEIEVSDGVEGIILAVLFVRLEQILISLVLMVSNLFLGYITWGLNYNISTEGLHCVMSILLICIFCTNN